LSKKTGPREGLSRDSSITRKSAQYKKEKKKHAKGEPEQTQLG